jgi:ribonuclease HI
MQYKKLFISCDGGSRGNPGPSALGVVITTEGGVELGSFGRCIGIATNNVAEYQSVIAALTFLLEKKISAEQVIITMDSQLVSRQLAGKYKITKLHLRSLWTQVKKLEPLVSQNVAYQSVLREQNRRADALVNSALAASAGS